MYIYIYIYKRIGTIFSTFSNKIKCVEKYGKLVYFSTFLLGGNKRYILRFVCLIFFTFWK